MKKLKEWMSDYLRYFMLILAAALLFCIVYIGVRVYQHYDSPTSGDNIEILDQGNGQMQTETVTEAQTEAVTESESESETETEAESESETAAIGGSAGSASSAASGQSAGEEDGQSQNGTDGQQDASAGQSTDEASNDAAASAESSGEDGSAAVQAETAAQTEAEPVYRTMTGACNFRSGPGYEYEVMAVYPAGTVVEFLGIVEGWCEVRIDGVVGYMGQRFFE